MFRWFTVLVVRYFRLGFPVVLLWVVLPGCPLRLPLLLGIPHFFGVDPLSWGEIPTAPGSSGAEGRERPSPARSVRRARVLGVVGVARVSCHPALLLSLVAWPRPPLSLSEFPVFYRCCVCCVLVWPACLLLIQGALYVGLIQDHVLR